jgi:signal transduction histidine kinase
MAAKSHHIPWPFRLNSRTMVDTSPFPKPAPPVRPLLRGLSFKVLALTIVFVLLGEVLIFLPSIANFRIQWMKARIAQAEIAALAAEAAPDAILDDALRTEILKGAGVAAVSLQRGGKRQLMLRNGEQIMTQAAFDLRGGRYWTTLGEALGTLARTEDRVISVIDVPPNMSGEHIEVTLHELPLSQAMRSYGLNILLLSIILSVVVAAMIYAALNRLLVRPIQRLSANMTAFGNTPEDVGRIIVPSQRHDEIGSAERELQSMQQQLQALLQQKNHLAALGLAVSKVSHDLRNMLTTAQVVSDSLSSVRDPQVQRFAPRLITVLDRAISFLTQTLQYGQARELPPARVKHRLRDTAQEVLLSFDTLAADRVQLVNAIDPLLEVDADREHLNRILTNLVRNALQAFEAAETLAENGPLVSLSARRTGSVTEIDVNDNGPGIPAAVRDRLFEAFQSAAKPGGTGLGLAIARELVEAHGGQIRVQYTGENGTSFSISIPDGVLAFPGAKKRLGLV